MQIFGLVVSEMVMIAATGASIYYWAIKKRWYLALFALAFFGRSVWGVIAFVKVIQPAIYVPPLVDMVLLPIGISVLFFIVLLLAVHDEDPKNRIKHIEREIEQLTGGADDKKR